jgi:hypothetical protein
MSETLFTRLAAYSQNPAKKSLENFATEVLAYLINSDHTFRRVFLSHIITALHTSTPRDSLSTIGAK